MTNEKVRDLLAMIEVISPNELKVNSWWGTFVKDYKEALQIAIKALEQQPCEDAVSRQAVKQVIIDSIADLEYESENREMQDIIDKLPSVTPEPPEDDDRKCMRCKHCIKREGPGWANPYGCDAWTCEFEKKEEDEEWEN